MRNRIQFRLIRISGSSLAMLIVMLFITSNSISAVNTFGSTGSSTEQHHGSKKAAIDISWEELLQYHSDGHHRKNTNGIWSNQLFSEMQRFQPQSYIQFSHAGMGSGEKGKSVIVGLTSQEVIWADRWTEYDDDGIPPIGDTEFGGIKVAYRFEKNVNHYEIGNFFKAGLPMSCVQLVNCASGYSADDGTNYNVDVFMRYLGAWVFSGLKDSYTTQKARWYIEEYSDKITDGKKSYSRGCLIYLPKTQ